MTYRELANKLNITFERLRAEQYDFMQNEGYKHGKRYETIEAWINSRCFRF